MNRHHPYGSGNYDGSGHKRGSSGGPGPDRSYHRGGPRGRGLRGRGGHAHIGHDNNRFSTFDQQTPHPSTENYLPSPQDLFGSYGIGGMQYNAQNASDGYSQGFGNFEAGNDSLDNGTSGTRPRRNMRREREDKVHDSIIEERIQRERPCRTLFIRNIKYETNSEDVRRSFEEHGTIKTFFDLIATRGMVFVTYYDLRAAERARDRLQGSEISGRPIDVHYSLPRDDQKQGADREKNQQFQGFIIVALRDSRQPIDHNEVRRKFQQLGDVKSITPYGDRIDQCYVEYYDMRNCEDAFDRLRYQGLQDGTMEITYAWEEAEVSGPTNQRPSRHEGRDWEEGGRGSRGRWRGRGRGRGRGGHDDGWDRREEWGKDQDRSRYDEDSRDVRGGSRGGDRFGTPSQYQVAGYNSSTFPENSTYNRPDESDRLEQAHRVQQLLAALRQPPVVPPTPQMITQACYPPPPPPPSSEGGLALPNLLDILRANHPYGATAANPAQPSMPGLAPPPPPSLLAPYGMTQPMVPSLPPPPTSSMPPSAPQPDYQALMALLASQKRC